VVPLTTVIVFAKVPVPGTVKTRLARHLGRAAATRLARSFLVDTWKSVTELPAIDRVLALTGVGPLPRLDPIPRIWDQGDGDLGDRMERALHRATRRGAPAIVIGTDAPGRPPQLVRTAVERLRAGSPAVLAPTADGGYHLIGVRRTVPGLLEGLPFGSPTTLAATQARLAHLDMPPDVLAPWYDIDELDDLNRLANDLRRGVIRAPATQRTIEQLGLDQPTGRRP
jgi:rSAM/selenodomain-associated transferase 1